MEEDDFSKRVQSEFTRQARQMASSPVFKDEAVLRRFQRAVGQSPHDRVLDVACGPGILAEAIAPQVRQVNGIDATPEMIRLARERFEKAALPNGGFDVAAADQLPFEDAAFEQVVTRLSFHHFHDVPAALNEIRRVLRPNGRLTVADIVTSDDPDRSLLHNSLEQLRDPTHVHFFSRAQLVSLISAAGFVVLNEDAWEQQRSFEEWAAIVADPVRTQPLEQVMRALARAGQDSGMSLREESGRLVFTHSWLMVVASRT